MEIIKADVLGFCMGVRKAIEKAEQALVDYNGKKVYTLGPLIHNPFVLDKLKQNGLVILDEHDVDSVENGGVVLIRAHGIAPAVEKLLVDKNCTIINATCPLVTASQKKAMQYGKDGFTVIFAGDKNHGETEGIAGFAGKNFILLRNSKDAEVQFNDEDSVPEKAVLLSQTTFSQKKFESISEILRRKIPNIEVLNTICPATKQRQQALQNLCPQVDGVLVIGGKNSANTGRLYEKAHMIGVKAALVERPEEIPAEFFAMKRVGITAGASTPDEVIEESIELLKSKCVFK